MQTKIRLRTSAGSLLSEMPELADAECTEKKDGYIEWSCRNASSAVIDILTCVNNNGDTVEDLRVERPSLEERFLELVKDPV